MARGKYRGGKATGRRTFTSPEELEAEQRAQRGGAGGRGGGGDSGRGGDGGPRRAAAGELPSDSDDDDDNGMSNVKGKQPAEPAEAPRAPPVQRQQHRAFEVQPSRKPQAVAPAHPITRSSWHRRTRIAIRLLTAPEPDLRVQPRGEARRRRMM